MNVISQRIDVSRPICAANDAFGKHHKAVVSVSDVVRQRDFVNFCVIERFVLWNGALLAEHSNVCDSVVGLAITIENHFDAGVLNDFEGGIVGHAVLEAFADCRSWNFHKDENILEWGCGDEVGINDVTWG